MVKTRSSLQMTHHVAKMSHRGSHGIEVRMSGSRADWSVLLEAPKNNSIDTRKLILLSRGGGWGMGCKVTASFAWRDRVDSSEVNL